jgi:riboflavin-specific deaminase-like protein
MTSAFLHELDRLQRGYAAGNARPFVTASFAISADGCLSHARGRASRISGPESLRMTHQLRAMHDAVLVGVGTVLSDDPQLNTRLVSGPSPRRVVLDSALRVPPSARLMASTSLRPWVVTAAQAGSERAEALSDAGADLIHVPASREGVSLSALLDDLSRRGVTSLMLEGGAAILDSFFREGYIDYVAMTVSPRSLSSPVAVKLGGSTTAALRAWRATHHARFGCDHVSAGALTGALHPPVRERSVAS